MATLTASELLALRQRIGDHDPTVAGDYDIADDVIQSVYDANSSDEIDTIVALLEMRRGIWMNVFDTEDTIGGKKVSQKLKHIDESLSYYNKKAGSGYFTVGGGSASVATLDYNLDFDASNE